MNFGGVRRVSACSLRRGLSFFEGLGGGCPAGIVVTSVVNDGRRR